MADQISTASNPVEKPKTLAEAMLAFQAEIPTLKLGKDAEGQVQSRKYKYLTLDKLMDEASPVLKRLGLLWQTFPTISEGKPALRYRLTHVPSGQADEDVMALMLGAENPQGQGSAISYGRRYAFTAVTGIVPVDEDDDGAAASQAPAKTTTPKADDRKMTADELKRMLKAIDESGKDKALLFTAVGADPDKGLMLSQGRAIRTMLTVDA